mmetsp:Transcript_27602/g.85543  ORF Transcript_27602/g.85543 Transcript_27602/m.85543 type:complete len:228 (-) Transcript_27602:416-1099(-)
MNMPSRSVYAWYTVSGTMRSWFMMPKTVQPTQKLRNPSRNAHPARMPMTTEPPTSLVALPSSPPMYREAERPQKMTPHSAANCFDGPGLSSSCSSAAIGSVVAPLSDAEPPATRRTRKSRPMPTTTQCAHAFSWWTMTTMASARAMMAVPCATHRFTTGGNMNRHAGGGSVRSPPSGMAARTDGRLSRRCSSPLSTARHVSSHPPSSCPSMSTSGSVGCPVAFAVSA